MEQISISDFQKLDIRIGTVINAENVSGSERLLKLDVDVGEKRQIIAGIASRYKPEDLIGKQIVVLVNLEAKKIMGFESQGMILCADEHGEPVCLSPNKEVVAGTKIR